MLRVKELSWAITALFLLAALYIYGIRVFGSQGFAPGLTGAGSGQASTQAAGTATTPTAQASATTTTSTTKTFGTTQDRNDMTKQREIMAVSPKVSSSRHSILARKRSTSYFIRRAT